MYSCLYLSKALFTSLSLLLLMVGDVGCVGPGNTYTGEGEVYVILPGDYDSKKDLKWSKYLFDHMKRRGGGDDAPVLYDVSVDNSKYVTVHIEKNAKGDFIVDNKSDGVHLIAKDDHTMLWLLYQYMRKVRDTDDRFSFNDLPACIISFNDTVGKFPFHYRDVYSPSNQDSDVRGVLALFNIDTYWGIWGHNIGLTLPETPDKSIYAYYDGAHAPSQYCFSSNHLFEYISKYIKDNCGSGDKQSYKFAILPNDNNIACLCSHCRSVGNSEGNATPAVTQMIRRLAAQYPKHTFFTSAYNTTCKPSREKLPDNAGVIVSAMTWKPGAEHKEKNFAEFKSVIEEWSAKTGNIYVWDYINNYDDYFTPFPILKSMQRRFKVYRDYKINGIFLNGSGYDYSTFEAMHTTVLAALMMNPDADVDMLVRDYFSRTYPLSGGLLGDFYCQLLKNEESTDKIIPLYGGIDEKINVYLNTDQFVEFYNSIIKLKAKADEEEAYMLRKLITALSFTYLEINRNNGYGKHGFAVLDEEKCPRLNSSVYELIETFNDGYKAFELTKINESGDKSSDYVEGWKKYIIKSKNTPNLLYGMKLTVSSDNNEQVCVGLTDGVLGLPVNYFYGWNIIPEREISIKLPKINAKSIRANFYTYPRHKIHTPSKIEILQGGKVLSQHKLENPRQDGPQLVTWEAALGKETLNKELTLKIYSSGYYHIAIDEIHQTQRK